MFFWYSSPSICNDKRVSYRSRSARLADALSRTFCSPKTTLICIVKSSQPVHLDELCSENSRIVGPNMYDEKPDVVKWHFFFQLLEQLPRIAANQYAI